MPYRVRAKGVTLVELLIVIVLSGIVVLGVMRLFKDTLDSHSVQMGVTDLHQNTQYALRYLSDAVMQLGSDLPDSGFAVYAMTANGDDSIEVRYNPTGASSSFSAARPSAQRHKVRYAHKFRHKGVALTVVRQFGERGIAVDYPSINSAYSSGTFSAGIDSVNDSICFTTALEFKEGDRIFGYTGDRYFSRNGNLFHAGQIVAENIDSLAIVFYDSTTTSLATSWESARVAEIVVRGRTPNRVPNYKDPEHNDNYKRLLQRMKFRLRNKPF